MKLKLCLRFEGYFMKLCHELMFCKGSGFGAIFLSLIRGTECPT